MSKCGECTLCCELLPIKWLNKPANTKCSHCDKGCMIYDIIDDECGGFECAYYQMKKVHIDLRPDNCKVIFEKITDNVFLGTLHPDHELSDIIQGQIYAFGDQGFTTVILSSKWKKPKIFLGENHNEKQITEEIKTYSNQKWQHLATQQI